jgi:flagellar P-ring protein precursor FlgI
MAVFVFMLQVTADAQIQVRIKDVATVSGVEELQLFGYGLVVGLSGTGDRRNTVFTEQTIRNMLKNMDIELPDKYMRTENVAAVMVNAMLPPYKKRGTRIDVTVSSLGDARSLEGGTLILTPLQGADGKIYATAQGPLATGGYDVKNRGLSHIKKNHVTVGRVPDGAIIQQEYAVSALDSGALSISLQDPDFSSAVSMAEAIRAEFQDDFAGTIAEAVDAGTVRLNYALINRGVLGDDVMSLPQFIARVENVTFESHNSARVVINEKTGTIVAGGEVKISAVAVTHGGIKVEIVNRAETVQPRPFTLGQTATIPRPEMTVEEKNPEMVVLRGSTTIADLAQALNSLGVSPRDEIAIFQAIKQAGALHARLEIL